MKKLFYFLSVTAALAFAASCAKEADIDPVKGDLVETTFTVTLDDATATKAAIGNNAANIDKLVVRAFKKSGGTSLNTLDENFTIGAVENNNSGQKQFSVQAKLVRNFEYTIGFFAYHDGAPYELGDDGVITMTPVAATKANDETLDAFYAVADVTLNPEDPTTMSKSITLTRPLAQVNILSDPADWAAATTSGITADALQSSVSIANAPNKLNLLNGAVSGDVTLAYALNAIPEGTINVAAANATAKDAKYIAMAYVLSDDTGKNFNVTFNVPAIAEVGFAGFTRTVNNMPAKRNYRTNLHGDIFTVSGDFTVTIDPTWGGNDDNQDINIPQPTVNPAPSIPDGISSANPGIVQPTISTGNNININTASPALYFGIDSNSDGAISYASSNTSVGTISDAGVFTVVGAGDTDVTIHQMAGDQTKAVGDPLSDITIVYHVHVEALEAAATPTFDPAAGAVPANTAVTIACATDGATIYYTVDGSDPTTSSTAYSEAITIDAGKTIKAIAVKEGMANSEIAAAEYTIMGVVATPTFSPAAGAVAENTTVTISCTTEGAAIHYTVDGSEPTTESAPYSSAITIDAAKTIKAIAVKDGMVNSAVASAAYTIKPVLSSISVNASGTTTNFANGAEFSSEGIVVTASYTQGKADADVTAQAVVTTPNMTEAGTKDVTVSYTEEGITKTDTYEITVAAAVTPKSDQNLSFDKDELEFAYGESYTLPVLSGANTSVTYSIEEVSPAGAISVNASTGALTVTKAGAGMVYARAAESETYNAGEAYYMVTVNKAAQTLSFGATTTFEIDYGDDFTEPTLSGAQTTVTYSIETVDGNVTINSSTGALTISGADIVTVTATAAADDRYETASVSYELTINDSVPSGYTITVTQPTGATITMKNGSNQTITSGSSLDENATVNLSVEEASGKAFVKWVVKDSDNQAVTVTNNAFTMPAKNVTVTAVIGTIVLSEEFTNTNSTTSSADISSTIADKFDSFSGSASKVYEESLTWLKLGSGSAVGYITSKQLDLSSPFLVVIKSKKYSSDTGTIDVTINGNESTKQSITPIADPGSTDTLSFTSATDESTIKIGTSQKRAYLDRVTVITYTE